MRPSARFLFALVLLLAASAVLVNGQTGPFSINARALAATDTANPTFFAGHAAGLYRGEGSLAHLDPVAVLPLGVTQPAVRQILVNGNRVVLLGERNDVDEVWASSDSGQTWALAVAGLPSGVLIRELFLIPGPPSYFLLWTEEDAERRLYRSDDGAGNWQMEAEIPRSTTDFNVNLNSPSLMFATVGRSVRRSLDGGETWMAISQTPFRTDTGGVAFIVSVPRSPMRVLLGGSGGTSDHRFYLSTDQGSTWTQVNRSISSRLFYGADWPYMIHRLSVPGTIEVSVDNGATWARVDYREGVVSELAALPDPRNDQIVLMSTGDGYFRSANNGFDWERFESTVTPRLIGPAEPVMLELPQNGLPRSVSLNVRAAENDEWQLPYTVQDPGVSWLTLNRTSGATQESPLTAELNPAGLEPGDYGAQVVVRSDVTANPEITVEVLLRVGAPIPTDGPRISNFAGNGDFSVEGDGGPALDAAIGSVYDMALGPDGSFYLTLWLDDVIRRIRPDGIIETIAGTGVGGFSGDGGPALQAQIDRPTDIAVGPDGSVYFADDANHRVRRIDAQAVIATVAGNGEFTTTIDTAGPEAGAVNMSPDLIAVNEAGLIVHAGSRVFRVAANGSFVQFARNVGRGDDLQYDSQGRLVLARGSGNEVVAVSQGGAETLIAGTGTEGYEGDGGPATTATFNSPSGVAFGDGMTFIADTDNHVVRVIDASGVITTVAGIGSEGFSGDGGAARLAELDSPESLAYLDGKLYINDRGNRRIRVVDFSGDGGENPQFSSAGIVNAASFALNDAAPAEIVSIFGQNLASATEVATSTPLPEELAGTRVTITDSAGATRPCVLFFVTNGQINCYVDPATAAGSATMTIRNGGVQSSSVITVRPTAPGLFAANANGAGVAAAVGIRVAADGAQTPIDVFDAGVNPRTAIPIDLGPEGEQVVLLLFGTGIRSWSTIDATIGGQAAQVIGVAEQGEFVGLDQVNVIIPRSLIGAGEVEVRLTVDGVLANVVTVAIQ